MFIHVLALVGEFLFANVNDLYNKFLKRKNQILSHAFLIKSMCFHILLIFHEKIMRNGEILILF
jgi:hypothetical protein